MQPAEPAPSPGQQTEQKHMGAVAATSGQKRNCLLITRHLAAKIKTKIS